MDKFTNIESDIENISKEIKENETEQLEKDSIINSIERALTNLKGDVAVTNEVEKVLEKNNNELEKLKQDRQLLSNSIKSMIKEIEYEKQKNLNNLKELSSLEALGEDVSDAQNIIIENDFFYTDCIEKMYELDESYGAIYDIAEKKALDSLNLNKASGSRQKDNFSDDNNIPANEISQLSKDEAFHQLQNYMNQHNWAPKDEKEYSRDMYWQKLHKQAFPEYYKKKDEESLERFNTIKDKVTQAGYETKPFSGFLATHLGNGNWCVAGGKRHCDYLDFYNHMGDYTVEECNRNMVINSRMIEGINISDYDIKNPNIFWEQHYHDLGTKESFVRIAKDIPEVNSRLSNGWTVDLLMEDQNLGKCANIYFDDRYNSGINVYECDGFYVFADNGRHRILAAQETNASIKVKVIGRFVKK